MLVLLDRVTSIKIINCLNLRSMIMFPADAKRLYDSAPNIPVLDHQALSVRSDVGIRVDSNIEKYVEMNETNCR